MEEKIGRKSWETQPPQFGKKVKVFLWNLALIAHTTMEVNIMERPLNKVDEVMEAVKNHILDNVAVNTRCPDVEDVNVVAIFTNVFLVIDGVFSRLQNSTSILLISNLQPWTTNLIASQMVNFLTLYHPMSLFLPLS